MQSCGRSLSLLTGLMLLAGCQAAGAPTTLSVSTRSGLPSSGTRPSVAATPPLPAAAKAPQPAAARAATLDLTPVVIRPVGPDASPTAVLPVEAPPAARPVGSAVPAVHRLTATVGARLASADGLLSATIPPGALDRDTTVKLVQVPGAAIAAFKLDLGGATLRTGSRVDVSVTPRGGSVPTTVSLRGPALTPSAPEIAVAYRWFAAPVAQSTAVIIEAQLPASPPPAPALPTAPPPTPAPGSPTFNTGVAATPVPGPVYAAPTYPTVPPIGYLAPVVVGSTALRLWLRDDEVEDGDVVQIWLNGQLVPGAASVRVATATVSFALTLQPGQNELRVVAIDPGTIGPATVQITVDSEAFLSGPTTQASSAMLTGESLGWTIEVKP